PTVFQLMAFLLELNRNEININTAIPSAPRQRLLRENPWLGMMSEVFWAEMSSTMVVPMATLRESVGREFWPKATEQRSRSIRKQLVFFAMYVHLRLEISSLNLAAFS